MNDLRAGLSRHGERLAFWALAGVALFVAHDAIYLAQIGPGQALTTTLRTAGHGYWMGASLILTAAALVAGIAIWLRMRRLRRRARSLGARHGTHRPFARRFLGAWGRLGLVVAIGFAIQENAEHLIAHGHAPGVGALLGPEAPLALPIIGLMAGLAGAIAALVAGAQEALVAAIEAALRRPLRVPIVGPRPAARAVAGIGSVLAHPGAGRAPPALVVPAT